MKHCFVTRFGTMQFHEGVNRRSGKRQPGRGIPRVVSRTLLNAWRSRVYHSEKKQFPSIPWSVLVRVENSRSPSVQLESLQGVEFATRLFFSIFFITRGNVI